MRALHFLLLNVLVLFAGLPGFPAIPPAIQIYDQSPMELWESTPQVSVRVYATGDLPERILVPFHTLDRSAVAGQDYVAVAGQLEFVPGGPPGTVQTIKVTLLNDDLPEGREEFDIVLEVPALGGVPAATNRVRVIISESDIGTYSLRTSNSFVRESDPSATVEVLRQGDSDLASSIHYRIQPSKVNPPAVPGRDFVPSTGVITFGPGETLKTIGIPLLDDGVEDGDREVSVELYDATEGRISREGVLQLWINDDELGYATAGAPAWMVNRSFDIAYQTQVVTEREGDVRVRIQRLGSYEGPSSVDYEVVGDTAQAGRDFEPSLGTLHFATGQKEASFPVSLHATPGNEEDRFLRVELSNLTGPVQTGTSIWVRIRDADVSLARLDLEYSYEEALPVMTFQVRADGSSLALAGPGAKFMTDEGEPCQCYGILGLLPNGRRDPTVIPRLNVEPWNGLVPLPSGGVAFGGDGGIRQLLANGLDDPSFRSYLPDDLRAAIFAARPAGGLLVLRGLDDGWEIVGLRSDGSRDPLFEPIRFRTSMGIAARPDGGLLLDAGSDVGGPDLVNGVPKRGILAFSSNGQPDPSFQLHPSITSIGWMLRLTDDLWLLSNGSGDTIYGIQPNGGFDPMFKTIEGGRAGLRAFADGNGFWLVSQGNTTSGSGYPSGYRLERYGLDGIRDPNRRPQRIETLEMSEFAFPPSTVVGGRLYGSAWVANGHLTRGPVRIDLNAPESRFELAPEDVRLGENAGTTSVTVLRVGDRTTPLKVRWETRDDTARAGVDFVAGSGELDFASGQVNASLPLHLLDNTRLDEDRRFRIAFARSEGVPVSDVVITIVNDDPGFQPSWERAVPLPGEVLKLRLTGHLFRRDWIGGGVLERRAVESAAFGRVAELSSVRPSVEIRTEEYWVKPDGWVYRWREDDTGTITRSKGGGMLR